VDRTVPGERSDRDPRSVARGEGATPRGRAPLPRHRQRRRRARANREQPPLVFHVAEDDWEARVAEGLEDYRDTLPDERRVLLDRYRLEDSAVKLVGIGSVGTRCHVALFRADGEHPLIL
jgi:hypothetical protein